MQLCPTAPVDLPPPHRTYHCPCHDLDEEGTLLGKVLKEFHCRPGQVCCENHGKAWPCHSNEPTPWLMVNGKKFRLATHGFKFSVLLLEIRRKFGKIGRVILDSYQVFDRFEIQTKEPEKVVEFIGQFCTQNNIPMQEMPETA